jgi:hypothetical protein
MREDEATPSPHPRKERDMSERKYPITFEKDDYGNLMRVTFRRLGQRSRAICVSGEDEGSFGHVWEIADMQAAGYHEVVSFDITQLATAGVFHVEPDPSDESLPPTTANIAWLSAELRKHMAELKRLREELVAERAATVNEMNSLSVDASELQEIEAAFQAMRQPFCSDMTTLEFANWLISQNQADAIKSSEDHDTITNLRRTCEEYVETIEGYRRQVEQLQDECERLREKSCLDAARINGLLLPRDEWCGTDTPTEPPQ